jgi:hypothetical protein
MVLDEARVASVREAEVGIAGFDGEGVLVETYLERYVEGLAELWILGRVDVDIDKAWREMGPRQAASRGLPRQRHYQASRRSRSLPVSARPRFYC